MARTNDTPGALEIDGPLDAELLQKVDAWWRAANYLSVGQTYLFDNPLIGSCSSPRLGRVVIVGPVADLLSDCGERDASDGPPPG